jgi:hypothetical protein
MNNNQIVDLTRLSNNIKGLELLDNQSSIGSLSDTDQFSADEFYRF